MAFGVYYEWSNICIYKIPIDLVIYMLSREPQIPRVCLHKLN